MSIAPEALGIPTGVPALGSELGEADAAPPIVTAVYRIADLGPLASVRRRRRRRARHVRRARDQPGAHRGGAAEVHIDPAPASRADRHRVRLWRSVVARLDIKYVAFMKAHATVEHIAVRTPELPLFEKADVGTATMDMWVNPLIVQLGVGVDL